jgi:hypothetical protein
MHFLFYVVLLYRDHQCILSHQGIWSISNVRDYFRWSKGRTWNAHYKFTVRTASTRALPGHAMKTQGESWRKEVWLHASLIFALQGEVSLTSQPLYSWEKGHLYPINRGLAGPLSRSAHVWTVPISWPTRNLNLNQDSSVVQPVG